jgi:hypothetical protein
MSEQKPPEKPKPKEEKKKKKGPDDEEEEEEEDLETADELGTILNDIKNPKQINEQYRQKPGQ